MSDRLTELTEIFRRVFEDDTLVIGPETTADQVEGWDSLSHINLILAVEMKYNIRFTRREATSFANVGELLASIESKLAG